MNLNDMSAIRPDGPARCACRKRKARAVMEALVATKKAPAEATMQSPVREIAGGPHSLSASKANRRLGKNLSVPATTN